MATIKDKVVESLVGTDEEPQLSAATRGDFFEHAVQDEETKEWFMGSEQFADAIAPVSLSRVMRLTRLCILTGFAGRRRLS